MLSISLQRAFWLEILDKTNFIVSVLTALFLLYTRSLGVLYFCAGTVFCSAFVKVIKRFIRQPRPERGSSEKKSYGMPSTHSATMAFYGTYIPLACAYMPIHQSLPQTSVSRIVPPILMISSAVTVAASRVWLGHHSWAQVFAGCVVGIAFALGWWQFWIGGLETQCQLLEIWFLRAIAWRGQ